MSSTPTIINVYPSNNALGIAIGDQIQVIFNQEMDTDSINTGTFVLTGPDEAPVFGPTDVTPFDEPGFDDEDILSSPYFKGFVKGTISFSRVDASGGLVGDDEVDYIGAGNLWRTVATFTPDKPLKPNVEYACIIAGDEDPTNAFDSGVTTRTVFDTQEVAVTGTGTVTFHGGYTGDNTRTYVVEITVGGQTGNAEYLWWNANDPLTTYNGVTSTGAREFEDGVYVVCDPDGNFTVGDKFQAKVVPAVLLPNNYRWIFNTGSGSILTPPSTSSASGISDISAATATSLSVSGIVPADGEYGVAVSEDPYAGEQIVITFSAAIDSDTLVDAIEIYSEAANGDDERFLVTGDLSFSSTLASNVLTIDLDPGQLYENNIVILEMKSTVADTDGNTLAADYTSYFSTVYNPLYTSYRRVILDLGGLLTGISKETVMLAILEASIYADENTFSTTLADGNYFRFARREYTTCMAELILLRGLLGDSSLSARMSKTLGDLSISRGGLNLEKALAIAEDCAARWEIAVQTGGAVATSTSVKPIVSVKGDLADDALVVGRQWEPTSGVGIYSNRSAGNVGRYYSGRRDLKTFRKRRGDTD